MQQEVTLADLNVGDLVFRHGFVQQVRSVQRYTVLIWPWMSVQLEPPEDWLKPGWSQHLTGPPDMRIVRHSINKAA